MKATWAPWVGQPMYFMLRDWHVAGYSTPYRMAIQLDKSSNQTAIFMRRWRVIPL